MRSPSTNATARSADLVSITVRRIVDFSGGHITLTDLGLVGNTQDAEDSLVRRLGRPLNDLEGTYVQTGNKLAVDLVLPTFTITTTWYVSKDGSVINGSLSTLRGNVIFGPSNEFVADYGETRTWTLVENDTCDVEGFIT